MVDELIEKVLWEGRLAIQSFEADDCRDSIHYCRLKALVSKEGLIDRVWIEKFRGKNDAGEDTYSLLQDGYQHFEQFDNGCGTGKELFLINSIYERVIKDMYFKLSRSPDKKKAKTESQLPQYIPDFVADAEGFYESLVAQTEWRLREVTSQLIFDLPSMTVGAKVLVLRNNKEVISFQLVVGFSAFTLGDQGVIQLNLSREMIIKNLPQSVRNEVLLNDPSFLIKIFAITKPLNPNQ